MTHYSILTFSLYIYYTVMQGTFEVTEIVYKRSPPRRSGKFLEKKPVKSS